MPSGREVAAEPGATIHGALIAAGIPIDAPCGGRGTCAQCRVPASGELDEPTPEELRSLGGRMLSRGWRLACQARVRGTVTVELPGVPVAEEYVAEPWLLAATGAPSEPVELAVDLGTTSVACELLDVASATRFGRASLLNPQTAHGADVLTRVSFATQGGLEQLRDEAASAIASVGGVLLAGLGEPDARITRIFVVGNPVMLHLLACEDPAGLGTAPYTPVFLSEHTLAPGALPGLPDAEVVLLPSAAPYLGSDAVVGALVTGVAPRSAEAQTPAPPSVLLDLGTNGEIVLSAGGRLFGASAAAGPAFEAVGLSSGMRAVPGAVDRVDIVDGDLRLHVLGGGEPGGPVRERLP